MGAGHKHQWAMKGQKAICILCKNEYKPSNKKKYAKVQGDYITFDTFEKVREKEDSPLYKLAYEMSWYLVPRVSELNSFRPADIDSGLNKDVHTIKNYRNKTDIYDELPMPDFLYDRIMGFIKDEHLKPTEPIINRNRTTIYQHMAGTRVKHNAIDVVEGGEVKRIGGSGIMTVGGKKPLHPHALRRGGAIYMYYTQKMPIAVPQFFLGHTSPTMTERYIGVTKMQAGAAAADYVKGL